MKRIFAILATLLLLSYAQLCSAQCTNGTNLGTAGFICVGSTAPSNTVSAGNYYLLNVIGGFTYTISSTRNGITARTADGVTLLGHANGNNDLVFAPGYSGQARIYNCASQDAVLTYNLTSGSNNVDVQTTAGTNNWTEHFYKRLDAGGTPPADPFVRYLGTGAANQPETFSTTFGGLTDVNCISIYSQSTQRTTLLSRLFAVRYRMTSTKAKGVYLADIAADDGVRLTVDGVLVFNRWIEQLTTATYTKEIFSLTGSSSMFLEYYETTLNNELRFENFSRVSNTITNATDQTVCSGGSITALSATNTLTTAPVSNDNRFTVTYQWQQSSDNVSFSNISGATSQNYTPTVTAAGVYYFRRIANVSRTNDGMPSASNLQDESNSVKVTILATPVVTITGGTAVCQNATAPNLTFTNPQSTAITVIYKINGGADQTVTVAASSTATVSVPTAIAGTFNYVVTSVAYQTGTACTNTGISASASVTVRALPNGTLSSGSANVCQGTQVQLRFTSSAGTGPFSVIVNGTTYNSITSGTLFNVTPNINSTTTFNLTKITDANTCILQNP